MDSSFYPCNQPPLDQKYTIGRFKDQVVVVAGGASGIGFAAAHRFANDGGKVAILDFNESAGRSAVSYINSQGFAGTAKYYFVDVTKPPSCQRAVSELVKDFGEVIHHVVNTVAYFGSKGEDATVDDWRNSFDVNVMGYSNVVQACLPHMPKGSTVVNLGSTAGKRAQPARWTYSATKAAISAVTRCMALDLASRGIRVNEQAKASPDGTREAMLPATSTYHMLGREGETSEVAAVVAFLSSKDASFVTGSDYAVDGGYSAMGPERFGNPALFAGTSSY